jgi:hypothetical protein
METYMFERKMDNCKPCGGAIPLCMIDEFKLPEKIVDRKVRAYPFTLMGRTICDFSMLHLHRPWPGLLGVGCVLCAVQGGRMALIACVSR